MCKYFSSYLCQLIDVYVEEGWTQAASLSNPAALGEEVCVLPILTAHLLLVYIDFMMSAVFPPTPLSNSLYNRPSCQIESKAFLKSTKQENLLLFLFIWLSVRVLRVKMWSVVR